MEEIILTDDDLKCLESRFGQVVRQMGPWNSDGIFGYESVPMIAVEKAAESLGNPDLLVVLPRLRTSQSTNTFIELLSDCGSVLAERIVSAYKDLWFRPYQSMMNSENSS